MIPNWKYRHLAAHKDVNKVFKEKYDNLYKEYATAVKNIIDNCKHDFWEWEHRWHEDIGGGHYEYEQTCKLCGYMNITELKPDVDYKILEARDSVIMAF